MATKTKPAPKASVPATKPKAAASVPAVTKGPKSNVAIAEGFGGIDTGFEGVKANEYVLPYYTILQGLSPQMETVEGAKLGLIINTTTNELKGTAMNFVTVRRDHKFVEWMPNRGGFVASYSPDDPVVIKALEAVDNDPFAKLTTEEGNDLLDTYYLYGILADDKLMPAGLGILAFTSTKIKKYKAWMSFASEKLTNMGLPMMAIVYKWSTFKDKNKKGEFYNWAFTTAKPTIEESKVQPGTALYEMVMELVAKKDNLRGDEGAERKAEGDQDAM